MTSKILKQIEDAIKAYEQRADVLAWDQEKNTKELIFALQYIINPPEKTGRKEV